MTTVRSFEPVSAPNAAILILGSMPGRLSLAKGEYYAHPQNLFWRFMGEMLGAGPEIIYQNRLEKLKNRRVALWDVLKQCDRLSSMDSDIKSESIQVNDFESFFSGHPCISHVFFNGTMAEKVFRRDVLGTLTPNRQIELVTLPSTSPANASVPFAEKLHRWQAVKTVSF